MRNPRLKKTGLTAVRMVEGNRFRMKRQPPRAGAFCAVLHIPKDGQVVFRQMNPDLVLASRQQIYIQQRDSLRLTQDFVRRV